MGNMHTALNNHIIHNWVLHELKWKFKVIHTSNASETKPRVECYHGDQINCRVTEEKISIYNLWENKNMAYRPPNYHPSNMNLGECLWSKCLQGLKNDEHLNWCNQYLVEDNDKRQFNGFQEANRLHTIYNLFLPAYPVKDLLESIDNKKKVYYMHLNSAPIMITGSKLLEWPKYLYRKPSIPKVEYAISIIENKKKGDFKEIGHYLQPRNHHHCHRQ